MTADFQHRLLPEKMLTANAILSIVISILTNMMLPIRVTLPRTRFHLPGPAWLNLDTVVRTIPYQTTPHQTPAYLRTAVRGEVGPAALVETRSVVMAA